MFKGQEGNMEAIARTEYAVSDCNAVLKEAGKPDLQFYDPSNPDKYLVDQNGLWSSAAATDYLSTALARYSESNNNMIELVIANNDDMALGAVSALQGAGYNKQGGKVIPVFGVDATEAAKSAIAEGSMIGTIKQDAAGMAAAIVKISMNYEASMPMLDGLPKEDIVGDVRVNIPYSAYTKTGGGS
jgi:methyl-galactoside transport system substrate-binding protein